MEEEIAADFQYSCSKNHMNREAWWASPWDGKRVRHNWMPEHHATYAHCPRIIAWGKAGSEALIWLWVIWKTSLRTATGWVILNFCGLCTSPHVMYCITILHTNLHLCSSLDHYLLQGRELPLIYASLLLSNGHAERHSRNVSWINELMRLEMMSMVSRGGKGLFGKERSLLRVSS